MKTSFKRASAACAIAVSVATVMAGTAHADTFIPLKNGSITQKLGSGTITVTVTGQSAKLSPGMVSLPTTRNAWVSGTIAAKLSGADADGGSIEAGYVVGCQVAIGEAGLSISGSAGGPVIKAPGGIDSIASGEAGTGATLKLSAGTIGTQSLTFDRKSWPKPGDEIKPDWNQPSTSYDFKGSGGSLSYSDQTIGVDGCGGYAQARLYVYVAAQIGDNEGTAVLWGQPFTLG